MNFLFTLLFVVVVVSTSDQGSESQCCETECPFLYGEIEWVNGWEPFPGTVVTVRKSVLLGMVFVGGTIMPPPPPGKGIYSGQHIGYLSKGFIPDQRRHFIVFGTTPTNETSVCEADPRKEPYPDRGIIPGWFSVVFDSDGMNRVKRRNRNRKLNCF